MRLKQLIAIGVASAALLTGCSVGGSADSAGPEAGGLSEGLAVAGDASEEAARAASDGDASAPEPVSGEYLVREASLGIKVETISDAAARIREIARAAGGSVTNEQFGDGFYGPGGTDITRYGTMTISVPSERLDATIEQLTALGEVRTRTSNAYDVQDEYVDVEARIATLEASIARMRALMDRTEDIEQIVDLETALSARQADLDSLQARLNSLDQRIQTSPVTIMLTTTDDLGEPDDGIVGALKEAWDAFTTSAALLITTVGALLPWLLVGGVALWALVTVVRRLERRRRQRAAAQPQGTAAGAAAAPSREAGSRPDTTPAASTRPTKTDADETKA